jgi:MraZ protein
VGVSRSVALEGLQREMDRFVSTFTNRLDAKGRVSVPAPFRAVLERQPGHTGSTLYCYPALDAPALDAGGERLAQTIDGLLAGLPDYSDERDELSVALYGDVQLLGLDGDGRIILPENLRQHASLGTQVTFVGLGQKFQIWAPDRFEERRSRAREKVKEHRKLFGVMAAKSPTGDGGADEAPSDT